MITPIDYHYVGVNNLYADNGLSDVQSFLYFPAVAAQMSAIIPHVFFECGLRFIFSTRSLIHSFAVFIPRLAGHNKVGPYSALSEGESDGGVHSSSYPRICV
jgi:hypothetical protein